MEESDEKTNIPSVDSERKEPRREPTMAKHKGKKKMRFGKKKGPKEECTVSSEEQVAISDWIASEGLNKFGDAQRTMYTGGSPLFDERTGTKRNRFNYLVEKFPEKPWNEDRK